MILRQQHFPPDFVRTNERLKIGQALTRGNRFLVLVLWLLVLGNNFIGLAGELIPALLCYIVT